MTFLEQQWEIYKQTVYPQGFTGGTNHEDQVRQAFYAGHMTGVRGQLDLAGSLLDAVSREVGQLAELLKKKHDPGPKDKSFSA